MEFERLGGTESKSYEKYFILFDLIVYAILFFASLGIVASTGAYQIYFYIIFGLVLSTVPSVICFLNRDREELPIDTVDLEDEDTQIASPLASWRVQLMIGIALSVLIGWQIISSQAIYVQYPTFAIQIPFLSGSASLVFNSFISALAAGYIESRVFFSFVFPTAYNIINKKYDAIILALIGSIALTTGFFTAYHLFVYSTSVVSLQSVAAFALINCLLVVFLRSVVSNILLHFSNNFIGSVLQISRSIFGIVI